MNFSNLVKKIREENTGKKVPGFEPKNGNERAKYLFLLEAPGPKAVNSDKISLDNQDPTAKNFQKQLDQAGIPREEIAIWNIVPWYLGNESGTAIRATNNKDFEAGMKYLQPLISAMPNLCCIVLVGGVARKSHIYLSKMTAARILTCHHTSARVTNLDARQHNIEVFSYMKKTT